MPFATSEVEIKAVALERLAELIPPEEFDKAREAAERFRAEFQGKVIWNINSTAAGGGVAEMLRPLLRYARGANVDVHWLVIDGDAEFFKITKRVHNGLHGSVGDGGLLGDNELRHYRSVSDANLDDLRTKIHAGDTVILHDPQTAGLVRGLKDFGAHVIWRSHIGYEGSNVLVEWSWSFLRPFLESADAFCFTLASYAPGWVPPERLHVIPPSIDPLSPKNNDMSDESARAVLRHLGIVATDHRGVSPIEFTRSDGTMGRVERFADILRAGPPPTPDQPLVVQISRWDRLKDMVGVMRGFADFVADDTDAHLALVGPNVHGVQDDPEGADVYNQCVDMWRQLPHFRRCRVQLVTLPMTDVDENAAMVNAIQRRATIVTQKSLYEGFGLTITEAMWKSRAVIATAVGGIKKQITDSDNGILLNDPTDLQAFGEALKRLLHDSQLRERLGRAARETVINRFLPTRHLRQYAELLSSFS